MVVWEDRGVLKPPKPPTVHATGVGSEGFELAKARGPQQTKILYEIS